MRDVVLTLFILSSLPMIFARPFYGLVMFTWLAYMRAPDLCWGFARTWRFSLVVALIMFAGFFINERRKFYTPEVRNRMLILLTVLVIFSVAYNFVTTGFHEGKYVEFCKILLIAIFTVTIVDDKWKLRIMAWTIALSLGFYGFKCGIFGFLGGQVFQGPGGLLKDNNDFSLAMVMNLPFLFYLAQEEKDTRVKLFLRILVGLTVITIVATHSRGGFLALAIVYLAITMKSKYKLLGIGAAMLAGLLFIIFIPADYTERLKSITDVKEQSAANRLVAWRTALNMIKDRPIGGVGLGNFLINYKQYCPPEIKMLYGPKFRGHVAHNSYLQIWAESGTPAFIVFMSAIGVALYKLRRLRARNLRTGGPSWVTNYTHMFEVSIYGYLVGATFLNRGQFDLIYQIIGLTAALSLLAVKDRDTAGEEGIPVLHIQAGDGYTLPRGVP